ncbi:hypothetical protein FGO68_gene12093 [Halteria grandinella]|uniref:Uncharacterized protein n=1 Tax=Halteria grandinella TaxID=5974 RepID=A0A8J8NQE0_HALGN|nr:hypothetical protein FGO68_gene12093 [Halteria grandinella]
MLKEKTIAYQTLELEHYDLQQKESSLRIQIQTQLLPEIKQKDDEINALRDQFDKVALEKTLLTQEKDQLMEKLLEARQQLILHEADNNRLQQLIIDLNQELSTLREQGPASSNTHSLQLLEFTATIDSERLKLRNLTIENNFYHQTTTIFLTIRKILDKEKDYCYMLAAECERAAESGNDKRVEINEAIKLCREQTAKLDGKLKAILDRARQAQREMQ